MKLVGYGVITGEKSVGIWPLSWTEAHRRASKRMAEHPDKKYEVVPIYIGAPITVQPTTPDEDKEHA